MLWLQDAKARNHKTLWTSLNKLCEEMWRAEITKVRSDEYFNFSCDIANALLQELSVPSLCDVFLHQVIWNYSKSFAFYFFPQCQIFSGEVGTPKVEPFHLKATDFLSPALLPVPVPSLGPSGSSADGELKCLRWNSTAKDARKLGGLICWTSERQTGFQHVSVTWRWWIQIGGTSPS